MTVNGHSGARDSEVNPLLRPGIPSFTEINGSSVLPAVKALEELILQKLALVESSDDLTWESVVAPLEDIEEIIEQTWGPVGHLMAVRNSDDLRRAYEENLPQIIKLQLRVSQSKTIFEKLSKLQKSEQWKKYSVGQRRVVENMIRDMQLSGIALAEQQKSRFNELSDRLSQLSNRFSNNVLDAVKSFDYVVHDAQELHGCPDWFMQQTSDQFNARVKNDPSSPSSAKAGPWLLTIDQPSFLTVMKFCKNRELRKKLYLDYVQRASEPPYDNTQLITEILALRHEKSQLLGFKTYAELSLSRKMAGKVESVQALLKDLEESSLAVSKSEVDELKTTASRLDGVNDFDRWDEHYYAELVQEQRYGFNEEELKPYFPLPSVLEGLFKLIERLFSVKVVSADGTVPIWNPEVRYFEMVDQSGEKIAAFFLDPYSRPEDKRGGAWMNECQSRRKSTLGLRIPIAYLICNFPRPIGMAPSLLSFRDVQTLFHEFGHGLQHMLTEENEPAITGIRGIEWDAVELPSQFMENWCFDRDTVLDFARHYETQQPLPEEVFNKIVQSRSYRAASLMLRQLHFATIDIELHHRFNPDGKFNVFEIDREIATRMLPMPIVPEDRMLCSFAHIFAGGYAAGYYSYKWAEVLSADAFAAFEEAGLSNEANVRKTGMHFRKTILASGGGAHPMDVFRRFRGREPSTEALLRHNGLSPSHSY